MIVFHHASDDLEQQCENVLFEVCDARERYPLQCAKELEKCIKLTNEINVSALSQMCVITAFITYLLLLLLFYCIVLLFISTFMGIYLLQTVKVITKPTKSLDVPIFMNEQFATQFATLQEDLSKTVELLKSQEHKMKVMIDKIDNLKVVLDQIKRDKSCEINKLLWN